VLLVCVLGAFGAHRFFSAPDYSTTIGEQRSMQLSDGTHVALNSETQLTIAYETARRVVHLTRGEAFFDVAKDAQRPFIVIAGAHRVTALGTSFVVRFDSVRTAVTLLEGKVAVSGPADDSAAPADVLLNAGQRVVMTPTEPPKVDAPRIEVVTAWRRGEVILDDSPLAEAVAEMNRYDRTVIVIDDAQIEGLLVSGLYHAGDNEGFARTLARMYHLDLAIVDGRIHLREITR
jgi:transmembrane sensor